MAEKKSLFSRLRRFLFSDANSKSEKKDKSHTWIFRLFKMKRHAPLSAPFPPTGNQHQEGDEKRITDVSVILSAHQKTETQQESSGSTNHDLNAQIPLRRERAFQDLAATKIQAAYRRYLARKALRALKGVVKLQAIIRGWAVRKQAINTLKCLQSIVNIQSEVCLKRRQRSTDSFPFQEYEEFGENDVKESKKCAYPQCSYINTLSGCHFLYFHKVDLNSQKRWDDSVLTGDESKALVLSKKEASIKRERIKEYYLNHRRSAETERDKVYTKRKYWLEQWVNFQLAKKDDLWNSDGTLPARKNYEVGGRLHNSKYLEKHYQSDTSDSPAYASRRSPHHRRQRSTGDNNSFASSPTIPAYMAPTTSAKAKVRSLSSPRLRPIFSDICSEINSPYKHKLSPISSINSEFTSRSWVANQIGSLRRSPYLQGLPSPVKSTISKKDTYPQRIH